MQQHETKPPEGTEPEAPETPEAPTAETPEAAPEAAEAPAPEAAAEPVAEPAVVPESEVAAAQVAELERAVADLRDRLLRRAAETENVRKRAERQMSEARRFAASDIAKDLFNVADNLRRALDAVPADALADDEALANLVGGLQAVERDFLQAFAKHQIVKLEPLDQPFDPNFHQAMFEVEDTDKPAGTVVQLLQAGYVLHERLLRPAMVGVAKAKPNNGNDAPPKVDEIA